VQIAVIKYILAIECIHNYNKNYVDFNEYA